MNKFHKKSSRKNSNYNNYKKENNTMSNNNYENAMGQVMAGQEAAQQNLVGIVRNAFDFAGFNTDFLNNPRFAGLAAEAQDIVGFLEKMEQFGGAQLVEQLNNNASGFFDMFLTMDDKAIEYINSEPELNRACLFLNVLTFVGAFNYVERAELLNFLLTTTVTCNDTEQCMTAARAWTLYIGLLIPQMAA